MESLLWCSSCAVLDWIFTDRPTVNFPARRAVRTLENGAHLDQARNAARDVGLHVTEGDNWTVLWSYRTPWDSKLFKKRVAQRPSPPSLFNHLPGTLRLASKAHLPELVRSAGLSDAIPLSFLLPEENAAARKAIAVDGVLGPGNWPKWVVKSKKHRGIRVLLNATPSTLAAAAPAVVQRRVEPLLLRKVRRAFDVGLYVLVTSVRPLRVYVYDLALVRFCETEFPTTAAGFTADIRSYVVSHYKPIWSLAHFASSLRACNDSAACALRRELTVDGHDAELIWSRMRSLVARLLMVLLPHVYSGLSRLELDNENVFELFRFDFLVDERGAPVLTEVNLSPNLVPASPQDGKVKAALVRDALLLVMVRFEVPFDPGSPRTKLLEAAEARKLGGFQRVQI